MSKKNEEIRPWGEEIWEKKIISQNELGVIHGGRFSKSKSTTDKQIKEVMRYLDDNILPKVKKKGKIMDAGIGPLARFSIEFAKRGYNVLGLDISQTTLKYANKHIKEQNIGNIRLIQGDLTKLDNIKEKFDFIFCFGTFGHIPKILAIETMRIFYSKLNDGGFCFIHFWIKDEYSWINKVKELFYLSLHEISKRIHNSFSVNCSYYSVDEIRELANHSKFQIISGRDNGFFLLKK